MRMLWQDIRYGFRTLARNPGFAVVVVLILGLGIGATTSVFSVVDGVLLRALPYSNPGRLAMLFTTLPKWNLMRGPTSGMNFLDWQQQNRSFEEMAIMRSEGTTYRHTEGTDRIEGLCVSTNLFHLLGWEPLVGRTFLPDETWPNHHYIMLGYDFWQRHFGGDEAILGKPVTLGLGDAPYTVVGIMPPGIRALSAKPDALIDFWIPVDRDLPEIALGGRGCMRWNVVGRLRPGVGLKQAQAEMDGIALRIDEEGKDRGVNVVPLHECVVGETRSLILLAAGAAGFVLLIACANVANLLLTRGLARRREMATRATLGAGWLRLLSQSLAESVLLSLFGGILGILLATGGIHVFRAIAPSDMARLDEVGVDLGTLAFSLGLVLLTGILVGLVPALRTCWPDLNEAIKTDSRGATLDFGRHRLAGLFVASQVSLSLILLISSGLLVNSLSRLLLLDPGYRTQNILALRLENLAPERHGELLQRAKSLPDVRSAALINGLPLCDAPGGSDIHLEGVQTGEVGQPPATATGRIVSPGYFSLMGISLLAGRDFTEQDDRTAPRVTIINESLARRFWADTDPIGKKFEFGWAGATVEIVGVVRDTKSTALDADPALEAFVPSQQMGWRESSLVIVTGSDPASLAGPLRKEIRSIDANVVIREIRTMTDIVAGTLAGRRFLAVVLSVFSFVAAVLASFGIYGVIAHSVRQRTGEIGIRMALGATRSDVLKAVLREGFKLTIVGMIVGLLGALALTRVVSTFLYGVSPTDPATFLCVSLLLAGIALIASYVPARRAARIDPMAALRYE